MLTNEQRAKLEAEAKRRGLDPDKLIAAAERGSSDDTGDRGKAKAVSGTDKPKLFMYLLPFVTVREVRQNWLGLTEPFAGDSSVASEWAAAHGAGSSSGSVEEP